MKGTMSMVLLGCMVFICLGSEFYHEKSNNRLDDIDQNVETRNGKFALNKILKSSFSV